ncbi:MAG: trypsin-like peptidase domain-containing protein [Bowdeniella nasicola]|nr:trypsin-like peptidase domain-containing protein [Bowdeniella nasicola]
MDNEREWIRPEGYQSAGARPSQPLSPAQPVGEAFGYPGGVTPGGPDAAAIPPTAVIKQRKRPSWAALTATAVAAALLASGATVGFEALRSEVVSESHSGVTTRATSADSTAVPAGNVNWESVASKVHDSVVSINTRTDRGAEAGSGVILDTTGHILTNDHVIDGAHQIVVTLSDGRMYPATLRGTDPSTDLAVITLDNPPSELKAATFGNSSQLKVGQDVVAVGNPLGLSNTVTTGVISALNRPVTTKKIVQRGNFQQVAGKVITNAIQLDASINPGNSGGPVFDTNGNVIGLSSSIVTLGPEGESGSIGLGFAIPANLASNIADQLIANGKAEHAYLGVSVVSGQAKTDDEVRAGAVLGSVEENGPAAAAGLREGDVITAIDGNPVVSDNSLVGYVRQYKSGDEITITYVRDGKSAEVKAKLAVRGDEFN